MAGECWRGSDRERARLLFFFPVLMPGVSCFAFRSIPCIRRVRRVRRVRRIWRIWRVRCVRLIRCAPCLRVLGLFRGVRAGPGLPGPPAAFDSGKSGNASALCIVRPADNYSPATSCMYTGRPPLQRGALTSTAFRKPRAFSLGLEAIPAARPSPAWASPTGQPAILQAHTYLSPLWMRAPTVMKSDAIQTGRSKKQTPLKRSAHPVPCRF